MRNKPCTKCINYAICKPAEAQVICSQYGKPFRKVPHKPTFSECLEVVQNMFHVWEQKA